MSTEQASVSLLANSCLVLDGPGVSLARNLESHYNTLNSGCDPSNLPPADTAQLRLKVPKSDRLLVSNLLANPRSLEFLSPLSGTLAINNSAGRLILRESLFESRNLLLARDLQPGLYHLSLVSEGSIDTETFIVHDSR